MPLSIHNCANRIRIALKDFVQQCEGGISHNRTNKPYIGGFYSLLQEMQGCPRHWFNGSDSDILQLDRTKIRNCC